MWGSPPVDAAATATVAANSTKPTRTILRTCSSLSRVTGVGTRRTKLRIAGVVVLAVAIAVAASSTAWASKTSARHATATVTVKTKRIKKLGVVLVNSKGLTLYMFVRDKQKKVTCTSNACVTAWPPLKIKKGQKAVAAGAAKQSLLGKDPNPKGGFVVTYKHWPLYRYFADSQPGQATGQAIKLNGGFWYVLSPAGKVIRTQP
jgi:predicted lipoprotein with Yx(FWY)xxD motif